MGIELMLRMYLLQCWFNLSDEGVEDAIYDSYAMRKFMGINFFERDVPDATTLLKFRHLLEMHGLGKLFFNAINRCLEDARRNHRGRHANQRTQLHQRRFQVPRPGDAPDEKGNQWHFGMKCHTGVDVGSGFVHTVEVTAANVHDITVTAKLLREDDEVVYGDSAYLGIEKRNEIKQDEHLSAIEYRINRRPGWLPKVSDNAIDWERYIENRKSAVRCKVDHPYRIVKNIFGFRKTVYRGLHKNLNRLHVLFASANLYMLAEAGGFLRPA